MPSLVIRPCPVCSHRGQLERPLWKYASRTSFARGYACFMWMGCVHAQRLRDWTPTGDESEMKKVEAAWNEAQPELFAKKTEGWTSEARAEFSRVLEDRVYDFSSPYQSGAVTHEQRTNEIT